MNIWLLSPFSPLPEPDAHESRTAALAKFLSRAGHQVTWFSMDWDHRVKKAVGEVVPDFASELGTSSPTIVLIPTPPYHKNISLRRFLSHWIWGTRLVRIAKQKVKSGDLPRPDLILASSPPLDAPRAAFQLQKSFNCKVKIDLTDLWPHSFCSIPYLPSPIFHLLLRRAHSQWRRAGGISAMSQEYLDEVRRIAPGQDTHLCYIGGTVGEVVPDFAKEDTELGTSSATNFLYLGAMTDSYDFQTLFEAVKILQTTSPGFEIHFAGSGPLEEPLKQQVKDLQLEDKIHFHGFLSLKEMEALCGQCHVGLNIIRDGLHITMPHKLNDYLCAGLDVISSLPGESAELLETYKAGVLYTAGDPQGLAVAMQRYLETKNAPQGGALKLAAERLDREKSYPVWGRWLVN